MNLPATWLRALALAWLVWHALPGAHACTARALPAAMLGPQMGLSTPGEVTQAWSCKDARGDHVLVVSHQATGSKPQGTELLFTKRTRTAAGWKKDWQARDYLSEPPSSASNPEVVLMKDADGDGLADVFIGYALPRPTAASDEGKLLVYYKDRKYAIRGAIARTPSDFGSRKIDPDFSTLPQAIQTQALQLWDKISTPAGQKRISGNAARPSPRR